VKFFSYLYLVFIIVVFIFFLASCRSQGTPTPASTSPDDSASSKESTEDPVEEDSATSETTSEASLAKALDPELLKEYVFYHGIATVMEDQKWTSKFQDGSHGEGDAVLTSEDYLLFEPLTGNLYIVARNLTYTSKHTIIVNDINGDYQDTANVSATGELQEYYSWGFLANDSLDFSPLPLRAEGLTSTIYTRPPTVNNTWVAYTSTSDTVRLAGDRVMPPDTASSLTLLNLPLLERFSDEKSYGNREARVYEATTRLWNLIGSFDYDYQKITFDEMLNGVNSIVDAMESDQTFSKRAEVLPDVWQAAAQISDQLRMLNEASATMNTYMTAIDSIENSQPDKARAIIDTIDQQGDLTKNRVILDDLANASADQSSQRKLEGFVMDSGDSQLIESFGPYLETIDSFFSRYAQLQKTLEESFQSINAENFSTELDMLVSTATQLKQLGDNRLTLFELFEEQLTRAIDADPIEELDTLFREWPILFYAIDGEQSQVNMDGGLQLPLGYPKELVPIMPKATLVLIDIIPASNDSREGYMVSAKSSELEADIVNYYTDLLQEFSSFEKMSLPGMQIITAQNNPYFITLMITENTLGGDEPSLIQITLVDEE
jgi:hypothetical protein